MEQKHQYHIDLQRTLIKDGPHFLSHKLHVKEHVAYLKPTISAIIFCAIYIVVGVSLLVLGSTVYWNSGQLDLSVFIIGFGVAISTFGATLIKPFLKKASFDKGSDFFNNGRDRDVDLRNILSLQINNKLVVRGQGLHYACFELNMLTKNGCRINVLNHSDSQQLLIDASLLGEFLQVKVNDLRRELRA